MTSNQTVLLRVITHLTQMPNFRESIEFRVFRYAFMNMVAKYSLSGDLYLCSNSAFHLLREKGFLSEKGLLRGKKSQSAGFTYEHPVPANVVTELIIASDLMPESIKHILEQTDKVVILTKGEDDALRSRFRSGMPSGWNLESSGLFDRYRSSGIQDSQFHRIKMYGAVKR